MTKGGKRKGAGRPAKYGERQVQQTVFLPPSLIKLRDSKAKKTGMSKNQTTIHAMYIGLDKIG